MKEEIIKENWNCKREKDRTSFICHDWRIDFTKVMQHTKTPNNQIIPEEKYEIEIEYVNFNQFRKYQNSIDSYLSNTLTKLMLILVDINGNPDTKFYCYTNQLNIETENHLKVEIWQMLNANQNVNQPDKLQFPGSMPVAFSRRHIPVVQKNHYFVSEKTDGTRYMLLIHYQREFGVHLIGRKFEFITIRDEEFPLGFLAKNGVTLIDGELVWHEGHRRYMFMVFDILYFNGKNVAVENLSQRFFYINSVVKEFRTRYFSPENDYSHLFLFEIIGKNFFPKEQLDKLFLSITETGSTRIYKDLKRHHKTDGIIFTPNDPYHLRGTSNLFKWKYPDLVPFFFYF